MMRNVLFLVICFYTWNAHAFINPNNKEYSLATKLAAYNKELKTVSTYNLTRGKIHVYTDIAKAYLVEKKYDQALFYLMKAKQLNYKNNPKLTPYYSPFADLFSELGAYNGAIEYQKKILQSSSDKLACYYSSSSVGALFLTIHQPDSSIFYYQIQREIAKKMGDFVALSSAHNNLGIAHQELKNYTLAQIEFEQALNVLTLNEGKKSKNFESEKESFRYNVLENLGRNNLLLGNFTAAIQQLELASKKVHIYHIDKNKSFLLQAYLAQGKMGEAKNLMTFLDQFGIKTALKDQQTLLQMKIAYAIYFRDLNSVNDFHKQSQLVNEQLREEKDLTGNRMSKLISTYLLSETRAKIRQERQEKRIALKRLEIERTRKNVYLIIIVGSVIFFLFGIALLRQYAKNKRKSIELKNEELEIQNNKQSLTIQTQENYISEFALDFTKNREFELGIIKSLSEISDLDTAVMERELKSLIAEMKQKQLIDKRAMGLFEESKNVLDGFKHRLLSRFPQLNKSDIQLCYLIKLDLTNKELSALKNVTADSIKIYKNRLKNKMGLLPAESLSEVLKDL